MTSAPLSSILICKATSPRGFAYRSFGRCEMVRISRFVYLVAAWLLLVGVAAQLFLAGLVVVAGRMGWDSHKGLGHSLAFPLLVMLVSMHLGRLPGSTKQLTWLLFGVYALQADVLIFLRSQAPLVAAFHPVLALLDFALGLTLARRAWLLTRQVQEAAHVQTGFERTTPDYSEG
jgi:hypothetical protein